MTDWISCDEGMPPTYRLVQVWTSWKRIKIFHGMGRLNMANTLTTAFLDSMDDWIFPYLGSLRHYNMRQDEFAVKLYGDTTFDVLFWKEMPTAPPGIKYPELCCLTTGKAVVPLFEAKP